MVDVMDNGIFIKAASRRRPVRVNVVSRTNCDVDAHRAVRARHERHLRMRMNSASPTQAIESVPSTPSGRS